MDIHNPYYSWVDVYQIAENLCLEQLSELALDRITDLVDRNTVGVLLSLFGNTYPAMRSALQRSVAQNLPNVTTN